MSLENARLAYPILVRLAREMSRAVREHRPIHWVTYDDFCGRCQEVGIKETPRTVVTRLLKPLQAACLEHKMPDLSALIIQKPKARSDFGDLLHPSESWWEPYAASEGVAVGDIKFWFERYRAARDYADWPEAPFF
ncbi:MAG: hypothetical protein IRY99_13840 [Isosphaeraceae bacterium]|nr:hypothetical protein [Isosphaeraceae bacterium]